MQPILTGPVHFGGLEGGPRQMERLPVDTSLRNKGSGSARRRARMGGKATQMMRNSRTCPSMSVVRA